MKSGNSVRVEFVGTERFWKVMCDPEFRRTSRTSGRIGGALFITDVAPEEKNGFIAAKIAEVAELLKLNEPIKMTDIDWNAVAQDLIGGKRK